MGNWMEEEEDDELRGGCGLEEHGQERGLKGESLGSPRAVGGS